MISLMSYRLSLRISIPDGPQKHEKPSISIGPPTIGKVFAKRSCRHTAVVSIKASASHYPPFALPAISRLAPVLVTIAKRCETPDMARLDIDINKLSPEERLDLIEELWDSLSDDPMKIPLTDAQAKELDRRLEDMNNDSSLGIPWETVLAHIRERK